MNLLSIIGLLKEVDSITVFVFSAVIFLGISQGWLHINGIRVKKKADKIASMPTHCLRGRSGSCELVRLQMESAEPMISRIRNEAVSHYMKIRKKKLGTKDNLANDRDVHHYRATLCQIEKIVKDEIRYFFRENHLSEMTEEMFQVHVEKRCRELLDTLIEQLDLLYYPGSDPNRVELYDYNHQFIVPKIKEKIREAFQEGRNIAIRFHEGHLDQHIIGGMQ